MKRYYTITYENVITEKPDWIMIWAGSIAEAVEEFCKVEHGTWIKFTYNEAVIIKIEI